MKEELPVDQKTSLDQSDVSSNGTGAQVASGELLNFELGSLSRLRPKTNFWKHLSKGSKREAAMPNSRKLKLSSRSFGLSEKTTPRKSWSISTPLEVYLKISRVDF